MGTTFRLRGGEIDNLQPNLRDVRGSIKNVIFLGITEREVLEVAIKLDLFSVIFLEKSVRD